MKNSFALIFIFICTLCVMSCSDNKTDNNVEPKNCIEKNIAVVLPMGNGLDEHWKKIFTLLSHNTEVAFSNEPVSVKLNFEWYDETENDLETLSAQLRERDDLYAVIGGLYSENASTLATHLCNKGVTFLTVATTEELIRAFASTGNLWSLTETDITQCEVLLSKVVNYGGESVALLANSSDMYGKTFIDWFGFQAKELNLEVKGIYTYEDASLPETVVSAMESGADYVVCTPGNVGDIGVIIDLFNSAAHTAPRLLFSDIGYGTDVLEILGEKAEGIEGVCFGADPETGFDVSFRTFFGTDPTVGAAQIYDAGMLMVYAAWYENIHPGVSTKDALRAIVDGRDFNMGSWMGEDMRNVVTAISKGSSPYVRGASGWLDFDSKVYTNVLASIYYNYKVYDGHYIILDYNTADGGNRTDATLAGWNWKATQMQNFGQGDDNISYAPLTANKAVLIASSSGWSNYRHQADVLAMYSLLKEKGYSDDMIILIMEDDIAYNSLNPSPGLVTVSPGGKNLHDNIRIDYKMSDLYPEDICNIIAGKPTSRTPITVDTDTGTNLLIFWSGHGCPGALSWDVFNRGISGEMLCDALESLQTGRGVRKTAVFTESCYSGSVIEECIGIPGMIFFTAAAPDETSKADLFNATLGVWMSNRFTSTLIENLTAHPEMSMHDLYNRLFLNTVGSHVMIYNDGYFGNLYTSYMDEFLIAK